MIYLFTGQPGSGKTTLAAYLKKAFLESPMGYKNVFQIDGDDIREICNNKDYSDQGRKINIGQAFAIAKYLDRMENAFVIISMVCPFKELRDELKQSNKVVEIYVHTNETRGREAFFASNYEPPTENFIDMDTTGLSEFDAVNILFSKIFTTTETNQ